MKEALKEIVSREWVADINDVEQLQKWIREFVMVAKNALAKEEESKR